MKIAVWFHAKINGEGVPNPDAALEVAASQLDALKSSGLAEAMDSFDIGVNGTDSDALLLSVLTPGNPRFHVHGTKARSEIPTMNKLRESLEPGWLVLYHHTKGITHPGEELYEKWRLCMERGCVWNWQQCVKLLGLQYESVGCHWLTPEKWGAAVKSPFWGGTFWWAKSEYLMTLPPLPESSWANRYEAESWIGRGPRRPRILDFAPHWPNLADCSRMLG
jgi:hypothetical protein